LTEEAAGFRGHRLVLPLAQAQQLELSPVQVDVEILRDLKVNLVILLTLAALGTTGTLGGDFGNEADGTVFPDQVDARLRILQRTLGDEHVRADPRMPVLAGNPVDGKVAADEAVGELGAQ